MVIVYYYYEFINYCHEKKATGIADFTKTVTSSFKPPVGLVYILHTNIKATDSCSACSRLIKGPFIMNPSDLPRIPLSGILHFINKRKDCHSLLLFKKKWKKNK